MTGKIKSDETKRKIRVSVRKYIQEEMNSKSEPVYLSKKEKRKLKKLKKKSKGKRNK